MIRRGKEMIFPLILPLTLKGREDFSILSRSYAPASLVGNGQLPKEGIGRGFRMEAD